MQQQKGQFSDSTMLLVLMLLEHEDKYGFQMIRELEVRTDKTFVQAEGMLYPLLHQLERQGIVSAFEQKAENGHLRRYYRLTRQGERMLGRKRREQKLFRVQSGPVLGGEACDPD